MKLKSSNNRSFVLLGCLVLITSILLSLKGISKKTSKYPEAPIIIQKTTLNFIQLTLNEKQYKKLKKKRDKALSVGILETSDSDYVPATITFNGVSYRAEIRLKGDWTDHLIGDKWSFRVKLKGDKTIFGMRKFSIHHPKTRGYLNEWLYHKAIKEEDLIGLRYSFLEGAIHIKKENTSEYINKEVGIYAIEETFDKRTIENNKRKESVILKFSEDYWWGEVKKSIEVGSSSGLSWNNFMTRVKYPITLFSDRKMLQDSTMNNYFKLSKNLLKNAGGKIPISDAYDIKKLAMQNALLNLFGATHGNSIINLRAYYNPITSKLEPIAFDGNSGPKLKKYEHFNFGKQAKKDSIFDKELAYALDKVSQPDYLNSLLKKYNKDILYFKEILKEEFKVNLLSEQNFKYNQNVIRSEVSNLQQEYNIGDNIEVIKEINAPLFSKWNYNNTSTEKSALSYNKKKAHHLTRTDGTKPSYTKTFNNIMVNDGGYYKAVVIARKGENGNYIGLRLSGVYPNRVDAIFDLSKGTLYGVETVGQYENGKAIMEPLGNQWYKCSVYAKVNSEKLSVIFGSTSINRKVLTWEASTNEKSNIYIIPSSIKLQELLN